MSKRVAIVQSCYIPWKGYFDLINLVDEFILYDDRQYTRRDWRNRNRIKTPQGSQWLTIPVEVKGRFDQRIDETKISELDWAGKHWKTLEHNYRAAPHFEDYAETLRTIAREGPPDCPRVGSARFQNGYSEEVTCGAAECRRWTWREGA